MKIYLTKLTNILKVETRILFSYVQKLVWHRTEMTVKTRTRTCRWCQNLSIFLNICDFWVPQACGKWPWISHLNTVRRGHPIRIAIRKWIFANFCLRAKRLRSDSGWLIEPKWSECEEHMVWNRVAIWSFAATQREQKLHME